MSLYWNPNDGHGLFGSGHFDGVNGASPAQLVIDRVTQAWVQNTITWSNKPLISSANRVVIPHTQYPGGTSNFTRMNVTKLVRDLVDTSLQGNLGFRLSILPLNNTRQFIFASSNHPNPAIRPKLELCWHNDTISTASEVYAQAKISVYPNPARSTFYLDKGETNVQFCIIYDLFGREMKSIQLGEAITSVGVAGFVSGIYYLKFDDGSVRMIRVIAD